MYQFLHALFFLVRAIFWKVQNSCTYTKLLVRNWDALQAIIQCPFLSHVIGVELSRPRFGMAVEAIQELVAKRPDEFKLAHCDQSLQTKHCLVEVRAATTRTRLLDLRLGDFTSTKVLTVAKKTGKPKETRTIM